MGFFDAAFKFQPRQSTTCFTDGQTYLQGTRDTLVNMITHGSLTGMDEFHFEDQSYTFLRKCNYADTIYGTWLLNWVVHRVEQVHPQSLEAVMLYPLSLVAWLADWYSIITSTIEISYSMQTFMDRIDHYNLGKLVGKLVKLVY